LFSCDWNNRRPIDKIQDNHPLPTEHLEYIDFIMPEFGIKDSVRSYCQLITENLKNKKEAYPFGENALASHPKIRL
jgi:hypothetical protein